MEDMSADKIFPVDYIKQSRNFIITFLFLVIGFLTIPQLLRFPDSGLDRSWQIGLHMAAISKFQFGTDIIFTFGPLGFLYRPVFCEFNTWIISAAFILFVHCLLIYSITIVMKRFLVHPLDYVMMAIVLILAIPTTHLEYKLLFSISLLLYLANTNKPKTTRCLALISFVSFLIAVVSLLKFTATVISFSMIVFMVVFYFYKKYLSHLCCMLFTYIISLLILLTLTGQKIANFPTYLLNSFEIAKGYNYAMSLSGSGLDVLLGLCIISSSIFLLLNSILKRKTSLIFFLLLNAGFVLVGFKHGFIRHLSGQAQIFFANMLLVFCSFYIIHKDKLTLLPKRLCLVIIYTLIIFMIKGRSHLLLPNALGNLKTASSTLSLITSDSGGRAQILENAKSKIRKDYPLSNETLKHIAEASVDILPVEISLAYAYDLDWSPRPIFQTYSAYTNKLDKLNSQYFESGNAPEILLYALRSIDGRYPLFDTPATFRTILKNYKPLFVDGKFVILKKTNTPNRFSAKTISTIDAEFGKTVSVPKAEDGYLFAKVYMDYNWLGQIMKLAYKPPLVSISLTVEGNTVKRRFIFSTAKNGIFLSQYIDNTEDLFNILNGEVNNNLDTILISTKHQSFYDKNIRIEFFKVPYNVSKSGLPPKNGTN